MNRRVIPGLEAPDPRLEADVRTRLDRVEEALEKAGARLFFGHDPEFWKDVPQAPAPAF